VRVALDELEGLTVAPTTFKGADPDYELRLVLTGGRSLGLLRSSKEARLEPARAAISTFLLEHGALHRP
jgi:hypothetical protein